MSDLEKNVIELHKSGLYNSEIAKRLNKPSYTIIYYLEKYNLYDNRVTNNPINNLIIEGLKNGETMYSLSKRYNCSSCKVALLAKKNNIKTLSFSDMVNNVRIVTNNPFIDLKNNNTQYWLGFLSADGSIFKSRISLGLQEKDESHIDKYIKFIGYDIKKSKVVKDNKYVSYRTNFRSSKTVKFLNNLGITANKSYTLEYKGDITNDFIRGVIDGDGYIRKNHNEISIISASPVFAKQLQESIKDIYKVNCTLREFRKGLYVIGVYGRLQVIKVLKELYTNADTYLERKYLNAMLSRNTEAIIP